MISIPVACRSCNSTSLQSVMRLPAGGELAFCPGCGLLQHAQAVLPVAQYDDFPYQSSSCDATVRHARKLAHDLIARRKLARDSLVIEAASNDGYLLRHYRDAGIPVLGIEPAKKIAMIARQQHCIPTREAYFTSQLADCLVAQDLRTDVFHAHQVLNRVPDLNGFVRGIRRVLRDNGLAVVEVPYVKTLLDGEGCRQPGPEPLYHFSLTSLCHCFTGHGLVIEEVETVPLHGGSLRLFAVPARPGTWPGASVADLLTEEENWGVRSYGTYRSLFRHGVASLGARVA
jgi:SAM-dependent methyltransferase